MPDRDMAPTLQIGRMSVPAAADAEWNAWYNGEYIPAYRTVPGVIYARRYRVVDGDTGYVTVYEFEHDKVSESEAAAAKLVAAHASHAANDDTCARITRCLSAY